METQPSLGQLFAQTFGDAAKKLSDLGQHGPQAADSAAFALQLGQLARQSGGGLGITAEITTSLAPAEAKPQLVIGHSAAPAFAANEALGSQGLPFGGRQSQFGQRADAAADPRSRVAAIRLRRPRLAFAAGAA